MTTIGDISGPYIRWENYGYEGWQPKSFPTLREALLERGYNEFIVTKLAGYQIVECEPIEQERTG